MVKKFICLYVISSHFYATVVSARLKYMKEAWASCLVCMACFYIENTLYY